MKPIFLLKCMSICSCSVMAWLCQRRSVCEQPLRCCRWWGVSSPIPWAQQCWDVAAQAGSRHAASRSGLQSGSGIQRRGKCWWSPGILTWGHRGGKRLLHLHRPWLQASKAFIQPNCCALHLSYIFYRTCSDAFLSICKHAVKSLLVLCLQLSASNDNDANPARLPSESVEPGEQKKLQLIAFGW